MLEEGKQVKGNKRYLRLSDHLLKYPILFSYNPECW